ncbi:MAG: Nramp family divalent metal transporter [Bacteroidota bacterium]
MKTLLKRWFSSEGHKPRLGALDLFKYIGPGLLVTVGFIDPGNWASNIAAGSTFGYSLLWMVTLSTIMLIVLQHNVAHLGIASGLCLAEAATLHTPKWGSRPMLTLAFLAAISTALAELLGAAIALKMLFGIPIALGAILSAIFVAFLLFSHSYKSIEKWIIGFVSLIGISFIYELSLVDIDWEQALPAWVTPDFPNESGLIILSVLGAVVMPHNLFLHSEIIQSRKWNLEDDKVIRKQLRFEFADTIFSMVVGWAINSAMILLAAVLFFGHSGAVDNLEVANRMLEPLLGANASNVFAVALLLAGIASAITAAMAGGSIFAGFWGEPFDLDDNHSRWGAGGVLFLALGIIFFIPDPFTGLLVSQMVLSIQLPFTVGLQVWLTSSKKVMGKYVNSHFITIILIGIAAIVAGLNIMLLWSTVFG